NWERGHDNGEAEVPGGGFPITGLLKKLPAHVGPVIAAPPGVKAGTVVRSGGPTPAPNHTDTGEKKKKTNTFTFFFLNKHNFKTKKKKNKPTTPTKNETRIKK
ncbi:hypothetical protein, partial [Enterobacter intestinihominis]